MDRPEIPDALRELPERGDASSKEVAARIVDAASDWERHHVGKQRLLGETPPEEWTNRDDAILISGHSDLARRPLPGEVPGLRTYLRRLWEPGKPYAMAAPFLGAPIMLANRPRGDPNLDNIGSFVYWEQQTLESASLWWVAADMVDVLIAAARSVPDDVLGTDLVPLDTYGFVVLERGMPGISATPGQPPVQVHAFTWGPIRLANLPERPELHTDEGVAGVAISSYTSFLPEDRGGSNYSSYVYDGMMWAPLGRSDWPLADPIVREPWPMEEVTRESFVEDRRVLCALNTLLAHEGIATQHVVVPARGERRRLDREAEQRREPKRDNRCRVVTLRRIPEREDDDTAASEPHESRYSHRFIVNGFWRRQPYGPKRALRRLQWIDPYVRGPEDKPLVVKEKVNAWRR